MRIGLYLGNKQDAWLAAFRAEAERYTARTGVRVFVEALDFDRLEEQGFDLIVHKMCTQIALHGRDVRMTRELDLLDAHFAAHPERAFDALAAVRAINDRATVCQNLATLRVTCPDGTVSQPDFVLVNDLKEAEALLARGGPSFALPWVCKPRVADGVPESHNLGTIVRPEGLLQAPLPCVLQPFVNHDGEIVKVYVLGDVVTQLRRPSLPNVQRGVAVAEGPAFVPFGRISNPNSLPSEAKARAVPDERLSVPLLPAPLLSAALVELKRRLGVALFGVDLVRDTETGAYLLIDVNYCPVRPPRFFFFLVLTAAVRCITASRTCSKRCWTCFALV